MLRRVKIKAVPKARTGYQVQGSLANDISAWGGGNYAMQSGVPDTKVKETLTKVPREEANLEAEGGETAVVNTGNIPAFYKIQGPRHTEGGVPLSLPDESFIFSDTRSMKIKDPAVLKRFGLSAKKGGYTPAEISKKFGLNEYIKILRDPNSDKISKKTAELMIKNAVIKLGDLALIQEAKKGFEQGIPQIAMPALEAKGITQQDLLPQEDQPAMPQQMPSGAPIAMPEQMAPEMMQGAPMAQYGMQMGGYDFPYGDSNQMAYGGIPRSIRRFDNGGKTESDLTAEDLKLIESRWNGNKQAYLDYINSKEGIMSNTKLLDAMYQQYQKDIQNKGSYTQGRQNEQLFSGYQPELAKVSKEDMVNELLAQEERNARLAAYGFDPAKTDQRISQSNKGSRTNQQALDLIAKTPGLSDLDFSRGYKGQAAYIAYRNTLNQPEFNQHGQFQVGVGDETVGGVRGAITGIDNANTNTTLGQRLNYKPGTPPETPPGTPPQDTCTCTDPETGEEITWALQEGEECVCADESSVDQGEAGANRPVKKTGPWLQDVMGLSGAAIDQYSIPKILPQRTDVDLVKPNLVTYDPTALYNQITGGKYFNEFSGDPRAASARQSQLMGQMMNQLASVGTQYDTMNQQAGQQHEYVSNELENKERMMDSQAEQQYNDRMAIAKQQYADAFRKGRGNKRMAAQNLLTNWSKTDALNQMYPNYQVDPTTGGFVDYTATDKNVDPGKAAMDAVTYAQSLEEAGLGDKTQELLLKQYLGQSRYGGSTFKNGGYVYTVFPVVTF